MEIIDVIDVKSSTRKSPEYSGIGVHSDNGFYRINGVVFCECCGKQYAENEVHKKCDVCLGEEFISGDLSAVIAGYLRLNKEGKLKKYYNTKFKTKSSIRMSTNRVMFWMLIKDGLVKYDDRKMEKVLNLIMMKKH